MSRFAHVRSVLTAVFAMALLAISLRTAFAQDKADAKPEAKLDAQLDAEIRAGAAAFVKAFDAGDADALSKLFVEEGEFVDEQGVAYRGRAEVKEVFQRFFTTFTGAKVKLDIESVRSIGPHLAIEEGGRLLVQEKETGRAQLRYVAIRTKVDGKWMIASIREFTDDPPPTPHDFLEPLAWLEGDWINEGGDATVRISYRWSDDKNYLLGDFHIIRANQTVMKSSQRIGWDAQAQKIRSWLFEADGSFSEGRWTLVPTAEAAESWVVKSTGTLADGQSGSATLRYTRITKDRFQIEGRDRLIGDEAADDFNVVVVRRPPTAEKSSDTSSEKNTDKPAAKK